MRHTILLVDDDANVRIFLSAVLQRAGYVVAATGGVQDGKILLEQLAPDLLITDVRLGHFNGLQLLAMKPQAMPAIVMTGFPDPVIEAQARAFGASFVLKPIQPDVLVALVRELTEPRPAPLDTPRVSA